MPLEFRAPNRPSDARPGRALQRERSRERILSAAAELAAARGIDGFAMRDVATRIGVTHSALRHHFDSKSELIGEVVLRAAQSEAESEAEAEAEPSSSAPDARPGRHVPHEISMLTAERIDTESSLILTRLAGGAGDDRHPAHEVIKSRYVRRTAAAANDLILACDTCDPVSRKADAERAVAVADGLRLYRLYLPEKVSPRPIFARYWSDAIARDDSPRPRLDIHGNQGPSAFHAHQPNIDSEHGYARGRERRRRIIDTAIELFARGGYRETSLTQIADQAGISKSLLLHHYASKDDLLAEVLHERDRRIRTSAMIVPSTAQAFQNILESARFGTQREPGLVELFAVLSCEASVLEHPAHAYFADRLNWALQYFVELFMAAQLDGLLSMDRDPYHEGITLSALWDGLQFQWLYAKPAVVDIRGQLERHLAAVLST